MIRGLEPRLPALLAEDRADHVAGRSFWLGRAAAAALTPRLEGDHRTDVLVVGGGFTGLWAALALKAADPSLAVTVLEALAVGYGASGRNGGFAMTLIGRSLHDLVRKVGPERARATHLAMRQTLAAIEGFVRAEGIAADLSHPGVLTVANGPEQEVRIRQDLAAAARLGLDPFQEQSAAQCQARVASPRLRLGHFEADALLLDPAALVRGLARTAQAQGIRLHEGTPVTALEEVPGGVLARTPWGTVSADRVLIATNAYAQSVPALRRYLFTVYAYILVTEPLTPDQWARVGPWQVGVEDRRVMPHFHRPTPDGRILWGGRDAPVAPEGPNPARDRAPALFRRLEETFRWAFPQLSDVRIAMGWGGPVCGTVRAMPVVGYLGRGRRLVYALGYSGHGVGPSHLVAQIARDFLLDRTTELRALPMATERPVPLPPGPLGPWLLRGAQAILQAGDDRGSDRGLILRLLVRALQ